MNVQGLAVIVTGGGSGLGAAAAARLARDGARVSIFDRNEAAGSAHAAQIGATFMQVDVVDEASVAAALVAAEALHGVARILVNCAGIAFSCKTVDRDGKPHPLEQFRKMIEINLVGTFNVIAQFTARLSTADLVAEERGVIINTASIAAFDGQIGQAAYAASKGGVVGMTLPLARELARLGIRVVTIAPGIFWTPMLANLPATAIEALGNQVPFPSRPGKPEEFALMVDSIINNPMLNGETIRLDGALRMAPR